MLSFISMLSRKQLQFLNSDGTVAGTTLWIREIYNQFLWSKAAISFTLLSKQRVTELLVFVTIQGHILKIRKSEVEAIVFIKSSNT